MGYVIILIVLLVLCAALALTGVCKELKKEKPKWGWVFFSIFWVLVILFGVLAILIVR